MRLKEKNKSLKREIGFSDVFNGTLFECVSDRGTFYIKGCAKEGEKAKDGIYAVNISTGVVSQPLMDDNEERREQFNHLYIYPYATFETTGGSRHGSRK